MPVKRGSQKAESQDVFGHPRRQPKMFVMIAGAALGFISLATAIGFIIDAPHLLMLHFNHAQTTGRIVRVIPNSHGLTEITYSVGGITYTRDVPFYWVAEPNTQRQPLRIYYDPHDPSIASAVPADEILSGQLPFWIAGSLLGAVFGAFATRNIVRYLPVVTRR
jgi:hypothetical protein